MKFSGLINASLIHINWDDWDYPIVVNHLFPTITLWIFFL